MTSALPLALLDDYQDVARDLADWDRAHVDVSRFTDHLDDEDSLVARLEPFEAIVAMRERTPFPASLLERLPRLRLLVTTGMNNASIDVEAAARLGVTVCGTRGMISPTAELTWGLIHALVRCIPAEDANLRRGGWQRTVGEGLEGRTLGLLGLGRIGARVAVVGKALGMDCIAWSQNLTADRAAEVGVTAVTKPELFERADVVSVHLRLSDRSRGLVGPEELSLLGVGGYLVNTSRAEIVDQHALLDALQRRSIAGAGLDVYADEPLPADNPLRELPNTVLTPHLGYVTRQNYELFYGEALEDVEAFLAGSPVRVITSP
jgi:phosphoglycerate dehydrogenase-like enzyme